MNFVPAAVIDSWLSVTNPLRGLGMARVVTEMENGQRGVYAELQWLYHFIEKRDATLRGAKRRILASLTKLDWEIKIQADLPDEMKATAEKQQAYLKAEYKKLKGLRATFRHLALCEFRGFAHIEKHFAADGSVIELMPVPQWHFCRDGIYGAWLYQADARVGGISGTPIAPGNFIVREIEDPINEIALTAFTRKGLSTKDFDAFIARFGIPFVYWILNDQMAGALANDPEKMKEFMALMRGIGSDGEGIFPGGKVETLESGSTGGKDSNPFLQHIGYQDEQIVMAATSGKLTMLSEATGIGGGATDAHQDTFDDLALALAMEISETLHEQLDLPLLARKFPGQEALVYFELAAKDAEDVSGLVKNVQALDTAGWQIDGAELNEKTGYTLTRKAETLPPTADPGAKETPKVSGFPSKASEKTAQRGRFPSEKTPQRGGFSKPGSENREKTPHGAELIDGPLVQAVSADTKPLARALEAAWNADDLPAMYAAYQALATAAPESLDSPELEDLLGLELLNALSA